MIHSKKGALFHWIIFGILAALGVFFLMIQNTDVGVTAKGDWQLNFLRHYYLQGEQELLATDQAALHLGQTMIPLLAEKAGMVGDSPCGIIEGVQYWNKGTQFCFPEITANLNSLFTTLSLGAFGEMNHYVISYEGQELIGITEKKIIISVSSTLQDKALQRLLPLEKSCLEQPGHVPVFDSFGNPDSCTACPANVDCSQYHNRFYCDLDPCNAKCVSQYTNDQYISCIKCPVDTSCKNYINQYYCEFDPCNYGCSWEFNICASGFTNKWWDDDIHEKITLVSFPESLTRATSYIFEPHFRVDTGYNFNEYQQLRDEALQLLSSCNSESDLESCLREQKKPHWKFGECAVEVFKEQERKVPFCIISQYTIFNAKGNLVPVKYSLGLDFTPRAVQGVEDIMIRSGTAGIELAFAPDSSAEEYEVYYTNWGEATNHIPGSSEDVFSSMPTAAAFGYFVRSAAISTVEQECPISKDTGKAHLCEEKILYLFQDAQLEVGKTYLLTITSKKQSMESPILEFVTFTP